MGAVYQSSYIPSRPERDDDRESDDRLSYVERELTGLRRRLDDLLNYIRADDMAPLTPAIRPHSGHHREEQS